MPKGKIEASSETWRERVRQWKASGLTAREFAAREGIERHGALSWWAYHLSQRATMEGKVPRQSEGPIRVVQLSAAHLSGVAATATCPVEIVTPSGARVLVTASSDASALQVALRALEVRP